MISVHHGSLNGLGLRVGLVRSRFNDAITARLLEGALRALTAAQVREADVVNYTVPGAVEIPVVAQALARQGRVDVIVALGAVIRGETSHYDVVCRLATDGCQRVALDHGIVVGLGILTTENEEQALARSAPDETNKGYEATMTAIEVARLVQRLP